VGYKFNFVNFELRFQVACQTQLRVLFTPFYGDLNICCFHTSCFVNGSSVIKFSRSVFPGMAINMVKCNLDVDVPVLHMYRYPFYGRVVNWSINLYVG